MRFFSVFSSALSCFFWFFVVFPFSVGRADFSLSSVDFRTVDPVHARGTAAVASADIPWRRRWYALANGDEVLGNADLRYAIRGTETLVELARVFGLGFNEIRDANARVNVWIPGVGRTVRGAFRFVLPRSSARVVVNLPEMRLYHTRRDGWVDTYPIGIGRAQFATPLGKAVVVRKQKDPSWHVPKSIRKERPSLPEVVPPGPDNPLGSHAIYLSIPGYLFHGTQEPYGIGRQVSHGCMRLYPEDVVRFFEEVRVKDTVEIVNQPVKVGWQGERLFLEVHRTLGGEQEVETWVREASRLIANAMKRRRALSKKVVVNMQRVRAVAQQADGMPHVIGQVRPRSVAALPASGTVAALPSSSGAMERPSDVLEEREPPMLESIDTQTERDDDEVRVWNPVRLGYEKE